eukprot:6485293-Amphidinium_carterae.1
MDMKDVTGLSVDSIPNERGEMMKCVIMEDTAQATPYKLYARHRLASTRTDLVSQPTEALRKQQAKDVQEWYQRDELTQRPQGLQKGVSSSQIKGLVDKAKEEIERRKAEEALNPPDAQNEATPMEEEAALEQEEAEEEEDDVNLFVPQLPSEQVKEEKGKGKQKGSKGKGKKSKSKGKGTTHVSAKVGRGSAASSQAGSVWDEVSMASHKRGLSPPASAEGVVRRRIVKGSTGAGPSASPWSRLVENATKYKEQLSVSATLGGDLSGHVLNQSKRVLEAMEKTKPGAPEVITLRAARNTVKQALLVAADVLHNQTDEKLEEILTEVMPHAEQVPSKFQLALLTHIVGQMNLEGLESIKTWSDSVLPCGSLGAP